MENDPKLRILEGLDHATYDAALIQTWRPNFQWVRTRMQGHLPFTPQHFALDTRRRIMESLAQRPDMKGQRFDEPRDVHTYLAFETLFRSMHWVHLRQFPIARMCQTLRNDLQQCLKSKCLRTAHSFSPLWEKGSRITQSNCTTAYELPINSRWDNKLLEAVAVNQEATESFVRESAPYFAELDRGLVDVYEEEFRQRMWKLLEGHDLFYGALQEQMRTMTINTWVERRGETINNELHRIGRDVSQDMNKRQMLSEMQNLDDASLHANLRERGLKPRRNREENILLLLQNTLDAREVQGLNLHGEEEQSVADFIAYMQQLVRSPDVQSEEMQQRIRDRLPALEYVALGAAADGHVERLLSMQPLFRTIEKVLNVKWGEYPCIAFVNYAIASYCTHISEDRMLTPNDLLAEM